MPIKVIGALNQNRSNYLPTFGTSYIASSDFFRQVIANCFQRSPQQVLVCRQPRCDVLVDPALRDHPVTTIKSRLGIAENSKILLWLPTYRTERYSLTGKNKQIRSFLDDLPAQTISDLARTASEHNFSLVIKLHPLDHLNNQDFPCQHPNIKVLNKYDWSELNLPLYEVVATSSALLTDVSSIAIDYLLTGRKIGIVGFNPDTYTREVIFPPSWLLQCQSVNEIKQHQDIIELFKPSEQPTQDPLREVFNSSQPQAGSEAILQHLGL
jgi:CDP-glycerol glycerophosphotransferase (TagB/SpsB family)